MPISIWDDAGGVPGKPVADVGTIEEVSSLPVVDLAMAPTTLETVTFDVSIPGLAPETTYYVVLDYRPVNSTDPFTNNIITGGLVSEEGTNGAGPLLLLAPDDTTFGPGWFDIREPLGVAHKLQMSVTAVPEPSSGVLAGTCLLAWLVQRQRRRRRMPARLQA